MVAFLLLISWEPSLVRAVCSYITPHNMRATLLSKQPAHCARVEAAVAAAAKAAGGAAAAAPAVAGGAPAAAGVEPWFGVPFCCEPLQPAMAAGWATGAAGTVEVAALPMGMPPVR